MKKKFWSAILLAAGGVTVLVAAIAYGFQDNISRFRLNPRIPFQLVQSPPPPDYASLEAWALWPGDHPDLNTPPNSANVTNIDPAADPQGEKIGAVDIFYIHPSLYSSPERWNAPIDDPSSAQLFNRVAAPNQVGPFYAHGNVFAPRYRQATLFAEFTHKYDGLAARELAFADIRMAFEYFLAARDPDRPIILVGAGQGALHGLGLLQQYFAKDERLREQLVMAHLTGIGIPKSIFQTALATIPPCQKKDDIGCVVAYTDMGPGFERERRRLRRRALIWEDPETLQPVTGEAHLCTNPLSWTINQDPNSRATHIGAASATGLRLGETPPPITNAVDARCESGILSVSRPQAVFLRRARGFGRKWRVQDYNLFYHDISENVVVRINAHQTSNPLDLDAKPVDNRDAN